MNFLLNKYQIVLEQGIMSLLNFCLIFVLSKIVSANLFKDFLLGYSIVIIITLIISSFANQPLQVFLRGKNNKSYFYKVFLMNLLFLLITSIICVIVITNFYYFLIDSLPYIITLAFVISIYDAMRRVSFVYFQNNFSANLLTSTSVLFFFFLTIFFFYSVDNLNIENIYISLIISYLLGLFIFIFLKVKSIKILLFQKSESKNKRTFAEVFKKHYSYASWLVIGIVFFWIYTQGIYFVAEKHLTVEDFNAVRISQNLVGVLSVLFVTFENTMLVKTSLIFEQKKLAGINVFVKKILKKLILPFIVILVLSCLVVTQLYKFYYQDNSFYSDKITYVLYFFLYQFLFGVSRIFVVVLKAINATKYILYSHFLSAIFTILLAQLLFLKFKNGIVLIFIMIFSMLVFSAGIYFFYRKIIKNELFRLN